MSCEHEIKLIVAPTDDACRFHVDVRAYKDRIVAPDEYSGATEVTPSDSEQVLPTTDKLVRDDITVYPAPTEYLSTDHNGTFLPSNGHVGFYQVNVNVEQLGVLIKTETLDRDYHQELSNPFFWYDYFNLGAGIFFIFFDNNGDLDTANKNRAVDMICFVTSPDAEKKSVVLSRNRYQDPRNADNSWSWASAGTKIRVYQIPYNL